MCAGSGYNHHKKHKKLRKYIVLSLFAWGGVGAGFGIGFGLGTGLWAEDRGLCPVSRTLCRHKPGYEAVSRACPAAFNACVYKFCTPFVAARQATGGRNEAGSGRSVLHVAWPVSKTVKLLLLLLLLWG